MGEAWSAERVLALAPDAAGAKAGRSLAGPSAWSGTGSAPDAVWGLCRGSGTEPYRTAVHLDGPAFRCSCPSRKFPCKHALGLLLLWSGGGVADAEPVDWVAEWVAGRSRPARAEPTPDPRTSRQRARRMTDGLDELDRWLLDQVRGGVAGVEQAGYAPFDALAARMVDAQLPGVAATLRGLPAVVASGAGWPGRLLDELALLHLLVAAHRRVDELDAGLAATVRSRLGVSTGRAEVLATPAVPDLWTVVGLRDAEEERFVVRRVWLAGRRTGRIAVVLSFGAGGRPLDTTLVPGTTVDADLHFYPAAVPSRALVGERRADTTGGLPPGVALDAALDAWAGAVAADPWTTGLAVLLGGVVPVRGEHGWELADADGHAAAVRPWAGEPWALLAAAGGGPVDVLAEMVPGGVRPVSLLLPAGAGTEVVAL